MRTAKGALVGQGWAAEIFAWGDRQVLKLFRDWCPDHWVDYEAQVARTVHATGMAVPAVGEVVEVDGRRGIVFERIQGPSMMAQMVTKPWAVPRLARLLAELHASMHARAVPELSPLRKRLKAKIQDAAPLSADLKKAALDALERLPDGEILCHGDFHPDNILMATQGAMIIDWPDATRGNPLADVARTSLMLRMGGLPPGTGTARRCLIQSLRALFHAVYLRRYFQLRPDSRQGLAAWQLPVAAARLSEDIPEERERVLALAKTSRGKALK